MKRLVVVESPTKARTIRRFLPSEEFDVRASMGHVRDLPASASQVPASIKKESWSRLGINVSEDFAPVYVVPSEKKKVVAELKKALKEADELLIATDEDREGESIGWHLVNVLQPKVPVRRMVFHEITRAAIEDAVESTRDIDYNLVEAQEARRILDRLVGYTISPLLWKKIAPKLSAGRVQSVAVRLVVMREKERMAFVPASYWDIKARLDGGSGTFESVLTQLDGVRVATGRDFDDDTGQLKSSLQEDSDVVIVGRPRAEQLANSLPAAAWSVVSVERKVSAKSPAPPFITSTLQQEGSRKLGLAARQTMRVAQRLYEQGFITYMRTDSTHLSDEAVEGARSAIQSRYGSDYLSKSPRRYQSQVRNAQEAHEAIRPAGREMKTTDELGLSGQEGGLYDLIWKRTVASQMADARQEFTTALLEARDGSGIATFRASGKRVLFAGYFRAYVEGSDDPEAALDDQDDPLPDLRDGQPLECLDTEAQGHETKPPARYTEASLIRTLEREGIGRPSTYATIMDTIVERGYVWRKSNQLVPTFTAFATNALLEQQFDRLVDVGFTAGMEQILDDIASGRTKARPYLEEFYAGATGLEASVADGLDTIDARQVSCIGIPAWEPYVVRVGRYGPYVEAQVNGDRIAASLPDGVAPADIDRELLEELVDSSSRRGVKLDDHPESGLPIYVRRGPYGHYVQMGEDDDDGKPRRVSLPPGVEPDQVDVKTAAALLALPRTLGTHPESGEPILANIGRYGPYVQHRRTFASLGASEDVLAIGLERALELIAAKEVRNKPIKSLGPHPETGAPVDVLKGRYGPYVKHQRTNASLPKGSDPEALTLEEAVDLLSKKAASGGRKGRRSRAKKK